MANQPPWIGRVDEYEFVRLIAEVFEQKHNLRVTKDGRRRLRAELKKEFLTLDEDREYASTPKTPEIAAEMFVDFALGKLQLEYADKVTPKPTENSLERYEKVGVGATLLAVEKAQAYHNAFKICPIWPFCH